MPDAQKLAEWLLLGCAHVYRDGVRCDAPPNDCQHDLWLKSEGVQTSAHSYQPPDPEDGCTMLAVLDALRKRRYHGSMEYGVDVEPLWAAEFHKTGADHDFRGEAATLPAAVWAAAEAVMGAAAEA